MSKPAEQEVMEIQGHPTCGPGQRFLVEVPERFAVARWPRVRPKASHASTLKHLRCQTLTSLSFGDKRLFREVSKPEQLDIPAGLPRERAFVWQHRRHGNSTEARLRRDDPHRASCPAAGRDPRRCFAKPIER